MRSLHILRPYPSDIRTRVYKVLRTAGYDVDHARVEKTGTPDAQILQTLQMLPPPDGLLIPFNAQHDVEGQVTDGLALLQLIRHKLPPYLEVPALMPVSQVGQAAFQLKLAMLPDQLKMHLFPIPERELEQSGLLSQRLTRTLDTTW